MERKFEKAQKSIEYWKLKPEAWGFRRGRQQQNKNHVEEKVRMWRMRGSRDGLKGYIEVLHISGAKERDKYD